MKVDMFGILNRKIEPLDYIGKDTETARTTVDNDDKSISVEVIANLSYTGEETETSETIIDEKNRTIGVNVKIDSGLSSSSERPVQNKVVTDALNNKMEYVDYGEVVLTKIDDYHFTFPLTLSMAQAMTISTQNIKLSCKVPIDGASALIQNNTTILYCNRSGAKMKLNDVNYDTKVGVAMLPNKMETLTPVGIQMAYADQPSMAFTLLYNSMVQEQTVHIIFSKIPQLPQYYTITKVEIPAEVAELQPDEELECSEETYLSIVNGDNNGIVKGFTILGAGLWTIYFEIAHVGGFLGTGAYAFVPTDPGLSVETLTYYVCKPKGDGTYIWQKIPQI